MIQRIKKRLKYYFKEFVLFAKTPDFKKNYGMMAGIFLFFLVLFFWILLPWYTRHNEEIEVIDLTNFTKDQAEEMISNLGLRLVIVDSVFDPEKRPNAILEQIPKKGSRVKPNRAIYITVNSSEAPMVELNYQQTITKSLDQVLRNFEGLQLKVGRIIYKDGMPANTVAAIYFEDRLLFKEADPTRREKKPTEPQSVPKFSTIDIVVYKGEDAELKSIPDFTCKQYAEAEFEILSNEFIIGVLHFDAAVKKDSARAYVVRQEPAAGTPSSLGTAINLWLEKRKPEDCEGM